MGGVKDREASGQAAATEWSLYLLRCGDGSIYTGIATDVTRRLEEHRSGEGRGAKYLRGRGPLRLLVESRVGSRSLALKAEARVKRLSKQRKERLVQGPDEIARLVAELSG